MRKHLAIIILLFTVFLTSCSKNDVDKLTYAVYPYLPDTEYYQELIEQRWAEIEPEIELVRAEWDCYDDTQPDGIDVFMYDAVMQETLIEKGWIQPIDSNKIQNLDDVFPFALEGLTVDGKLYGIPVFLCGNFLIYDLDCDEIANAAHLTDLNNESELLVINSKTPLNRSQYIHEILADRLKEANPSAMGDEEDLMSLIDKLAVDAHEEDDDTQVALTYNSGVGKGYIGFSESMRFLSDRISRTGIKTISFSENDDLPRVYADAVAVNSKVKGPRYEKCMELISVYMEADVLSSLSVQNDAPQYFLITRKQPYASLIEKFPIYEQLEKLASDENNKVILGPRP